MLIINVEHQCTMSEEKKEAVEIVLKKDSQGLTIAEISKLLKISRNTVAVALAELKGEGKIRIRPVGKAKLNYWLRAGK